MCEIRGGPCTDGAGGRVEALPLGRSGAVGGAGEGFVGMSEGDGLDGAGECDVAGGGLAGMDGASLRRAGVASSVVRGPMVEPTVGMVGIVGALE